jgi:putative ABC transport system permease protein
VLTLRLTVPPGGLSRDSIPGFYTQLTDRLAGLPGVTNVGLAACPPLGGGCNKTLVDLMDRPSVEPQKRPLIEIHWATPSWFETGHVSLKRGRFFANTDRLDAPKVVVINETAARLWWPGVDPIGKRLGLGQGGFDKGAEIVGVVGDVRQVADSAPMPSAYVSYLQAPRGSAMIFVRTARDPGALGPDVRRALRELAPTYPVHDMMPLEERTAAATAQARFSAILLGLFAATALSLAVVGIYGVMSLAVTTRTRELGIRIALGADQSRVRRLVVTEGIALVSVGAAIGLAGALLSTRVLSTLLYDLEPSDPVTYVAIIALLGGAAMLASWIPARRASRVDPMVALRSE